MRRFAVSGFLVGLSFIAFATAATACHEPRGYLGKSAAGPGEPVPFDITGTDPGAGYNITAAGQGVASGTDTDGGPGEGTSGSFTMPDLGDLPRMVNVMFNVEHEGSTWQSPESIQYTPPPPPPAPSEPAATGARAGGSGAGGSGADKSKGKEIDDRAGDRSAVSPASAATPPASPLPAPAATPSPVTEPQRAASKVAARERTDSSVPDRVLDAVSGRTAVGSAEVPTLGLLLMALIFVAGTGLTAYAIYLMQTGPDPKAAIRAPAPLGPDPVDVELQEMIAEEMARQLLSDLNLPDAGDRARLTR
jgi:hypothetical protein